jgi:hypothetical protein
MILFVNAVAFWIASDECGFQLGSEAQKRFIGELFVEFLLALLLPDNVCKRRQLESCGVSKLFAREIVEESDSSVRTFSAVRDAVGIQFFRWLI